MLNFAKFKGSGLPLSHHDDSFRMGGWCEIGSSGSRRDARRGAHASFTTTMRTATRVAVRIRGAHVLFGGWRVGDVRLVRVDRAATRVTAHMFHS